MKQQTALSMPALCANSV